MTDHSSQLSNVLRFCRRLCFQVIKLWLIWSGLMSVAITAGSVRQYICKQIFGMQIRTLPNDAKVSSSKVCYVSFYAVFVSTGKLYLHIRMVIDKVILIKNNLQTIQKYIQNNMLDLHPIILILFNTFLHFSFACILKVLESLGWSPVSVNPRL